MEKLDFTEKLIHQYERYVAPVTFIVGFVFDSLTMRRIDLWLDHIVLLSYLLLAGAGIIILQAYEAGRLRLRHIERIIPFVPVVMQFALGGMFSVFVLFYIKSAAFSKSWLFLLPLIILFVGNERFRLHYQRLIFQMSIYFTVLFSYTIFAVPLVIKKIGDGIFFVSGLASLVLAGLFVLLLFYVTRKQIREHLYSLIASIGIIYLIFNIFYFTNIIPPIPLSLKESGVYHSLRSQNGVYYATYEKAPWYLFLQTTHSTYHWRGEPIYYYSAVFAPTKLSTAILHHWYYFNEKNNSWTDQGSVEFLITGGRDGGYRGYSFKTGITPGKWRVDVTNTRGQTLGSQTFTVVESQNTPPLQSIVE